MLAHQRQSPVPHCTPECGFLQCLAAARVHLLLGAAGDLAAGERTGPCWGVPEGAGDRAASSARLQGDQAAWVGPEAVQACCPGPRWAWQAWRSTWGPRRSRDSRQLQS